MKGQLLIFDFDGTIVESGPGLVRSIRHALSAMGIEEPDDKKLERFIGPPLNIGFRDWYHMSEEQIPHAMKIFRQRYDEKGVYEARVYPGITDCLRAAKERGIPMAIASAKPLYYIEKMVQHFELGSYFEQIVGPGLNDELENKAGQDVKGRMIRQVCTHFPNTPAHACIMIGDKASDIKAGKEQGCQTIGVLYGYGSFEELKQAGPDRMVESVQDLRKLLGLDG